MILGVIQARMSSTRLPGKVLAPILGRPMLALQVERLARCRTIDRLVLATSDRADDDAVAALGAALGLAVHRGPLEDVLARFAGALSAFGPASHVARFTADCPLIDWRVVDALIAHGLAAGADYAGVNWPAPTWPKGMDAELARAEALSAAAAEAHDPYEREHVMPFLYRRPERFALTGLARAPDLSHLRWTVDTPADLAFARGVFEALHPRDPDFGWPAIAALSPATAPQP